MGVRTTDAMHPGFATQESEESVVEQLPIEGELPDWLTGSLLRIGPAKFEAGDTQVRHWFDGYAMLHRFSIGGGSVSYGCRFLDSRAYRAARKGRIAYSEFATDPCRTLFSRVHALFSANALTDNANVNVAELGDQMLAMSEAPLSVEFDRRTLGAAGVSVAAPGHLTTAHPHRDRESGALLNYAVRLGPRSSYRFFSLEPGAAKPRVLASWGVSQPAYMHSFGLSKRWLAMAEFPFVVNPARLALAGRPYIENFRWKPKRGTRFHLVDRHTGEVRSGFETDPCFAFHHVNAYDEGDQLVLDLVVFEDPSLIEDLYLERLRAGIAVAPGMLTRFRLDLGSGDVSSELLSEANIELPRINYGSCNERPYRYVWGVGVGDSGFYDHLVKIDTSDGSRLFWDEPAGYPGEPVFVPRPGGDAEDDGVLLSVVLDVDTLASSLVVLDAAGLGELARVEAPARIPFGFHGQFV